MRKVRLEQLPPEVHALFEAAQSRRILVTRNGEPFVVLASVGDKDEEDLALEESPEFWQMIRERRCEKVRRRRCHLKSCGPKSRPRSSAMRRKAGRRPRRRPPGRREVLMEFAVESRKLLGVSLEGSVG
jgi:hypothetical protein